MVKTLVVYAYHQTDVAESHLIHFVRYGMYHRRSIHYCIVINGSHKVEDKYLRQFDTVIQRPNTGHDFGAWKEGLLKCNALSYDFVLCLNDTVKGPYIVKNWVPRFTSLLSATCLLSGISINCCTKRNYVRLAREKRVAPHVQSMLWATNRKGLRVLWKLLMEKSKTEKRDLVIQKEIGMSMKILRSGYNITCLLKKYRHDYRIKKNWVKYAHHNPTAGKGNVWNRKSYYGGKVNVKESIFRKVLNGGKTVNRLKTKTPIRSRLRLQQRANVVALRRLLKL